jgi:peptidoglycan/LPS O-acetylase OafA/YrhL
MQTLIDSKRDSIEPKRSEISEAVDLSNDKIELKQNYQSIQVMRGIAAVMVVWLHLGLLENSWASQMPHILSPFVRLGHAGVDVFFIISGFVLASAHWADFGRGKVVSFLLKRLIRVYPYFLVTSIPFLLKTYSEKHYFSGKTLSGLLLAPTGAGLINPVAWSLAFEIVFYAAFACLLPFRRSILVPGLIVWTLLIAVFNNCFLTINFHDCRYLETLLNPLSLEFMAGILLAALIKRKIAIPAVSTIIVATIWLVVGCVMRHPGATNDFIFDGWRCMWFGIPCFFLLYGLLHLELTSNQMRFPKFLLVLGNASYSIYLLHILLLMWTVNWFISQNTPINCLAASLGCALLFPALCIPFYYLVEKPLLNFCKNLLRISRAA